MRCIPLAFMWEFWRRGWVMMLTLPLGLAILPAFAYCIMYYGGVETIKETRVGKEIFYPFYACSLVGATAAILRSVGSPIQRYTLPISTKSLVGWNMLIAAVAVAWTYLALAALLNITFAAGWPYLGPALFAAVVAACAHAAYWAFGRSYVLQSCTAIAAVGLWIAYQIVVVPGTRAEAPGNWTDVTLYNLVTMILTTVAVYTMAVDECRDSEERHVQRIDGQRNLPAWSCACSWSVLPGWKGRRVAHGRTGVPRQKSWGNAHASVFVWGWLLGVLDLYGNRCFVGAREKVVVQYADDRRIWNSVRRDTDR